MPHFCSKNNAYVVTLDELIPEFWKNYNSLANEIWRYKDKDYGIKRVQYGGNGRQFLVDFDSLPVTIQEAIGDDRKSNHPLEKFFKLDGNAESYYTNYTYPDGSYLSPKAIQQYIVNASVLQALLKLRAAREFERLSKGGTLRGLTASLVEDAKSFNEVLEKRHKLHPHNIPTSKRFISKLNNFNDNGYDALIKDSEGKRKKNALKNDDRTQVLLNAMFTSQEDKPTPRKIADQYNAFLSGYLEITDKKHGVMFDPKEFKKLSESSIRKFLTSWESEIGTHAIRNGHAQKLIQKFIPYHSFEQAKKSGQLLSIDDRQPPFHYENGKRLWFYNAIDTGSEAFTCWVYGKTKEGIILDFYRQLIRNYHEWGMNLPDGLECERSLNSSFENTFLKEGLMFQNVRIEANKARAKRIESYYRELRYGIEKEHEGWLARPHSRSEPNQTSNAKKKIIPYNQLVKQCLRDIVTWNNMEHSKIKGKTRWEVFLETQDPNLKPTNYKAILPYLGYSEKSSCKAGIVELQYNKWLLGDNGEIFTGSKLINLMKTVEQKDVEIYYLDDNEGNVFKAMIYNEGRYICELLPKPKPPRPHIARTATDNLEFNLMARYTETVTSFMKEQKKALIDVFVDDKRSKTLNNKFKIAGVETDYKESTEPVQEVPTLKEDENITDNQISTGNSWESAFLK